MKQLLLLITCLSLFAVARAQETLEDIEVVEMPMAENPENKQPDIFVIVEDMPQFPGGDQALYKFINENVQYPDSAVTVGLEDLVLIRFVVDENGKVTDPKAVKGMFDILTEEALRVVSILPDFIPGKQRGKAVKVYYTVPFSFKL